jgi:hypothetical protein
MNEYVVDDPGDQPAERDREDLVPDEERDAGQRRVDVVIERWVHHRGNRQGEQPERPAPTPGLRLPHRATILLRLRAA